jgi:alpha-glucosidase
VAAGADGTADCGADGPDPAWPSARDEDHDDEVCMASWWQGSVGYEVYIRSFADSDGDGVGDLPGITSRLDHLAGLGVDVVWITPFYPSPQADHGYDVADYLGVDPRFGTLDDVDALVARADELGLKVIVDLVPNHTSDQHPWFVDSRSSRDAEHRDWYVWRDPAPDGGPPNNWVSHFGGPAWTFDETTGQYYMHLFLPEQPDLNWHEPAVRRAFEGILTSWFERGVDGVRIDVAHSLMEDPQYRDNPDPGPLPPGTGPGEVFAAFEHEHDLDQDEVFEIYESWNRLAAKHDTVLLGEVYLLDPDKVARYVDGDRLHSSFCFATVHVDWDADEIRDTLRAYVEASSDQLAWPLSSHDDPRAPTRFGGGEVGTRRSLAYLTLLAGLPGVPFLYQGDELGLPDADIPHSSDPVAVRNPGAVGRDPCRSPMLWEPGPGFGFTSGEPWLPFGDTRQDVQTVAAQRDRPGSPLERTRALLRTRRELPAITDGSPTTWLTDAGAVVAVPRGADVVVALNVSDTPATVPLPRTGRLAFATDDHVEVVDSQLRLPEDAAAIVALAPPTP